MEALPLCFAACCRDAGYHPCRVPSRQLWSLQHLRQQGYSGVTLITQAAGQPHKVKATLESSQGAQDLLVRTSALPAVPIDEQHVCHANR